MSQQQKKACFLCGRESQIADVLGHHLLEQFSCPCCGRYAIDASVQDRAQTELSTKQKLQMSALIREHNILKLPPIRLLREPASDEVKGFYSITFAELLRKWPGSVPDRLNRALCNLAESSSFLGRAIECPHSDCAIMFAQNPDEGNYIVKALKERRFIDYNAGGDSYDITITPSGWQRYEELKKGASSPRNPVFVAMWFGSNEIEGSIAQMHELFDNGIEPACNKAGYRSIRADISDHNDYIMDHVFALVRLAPFVVADFTGNRNGVYFESGFARGLGIPVINCCKECDFEKAHFDTKQLNHIFWSKPEEVLEPLKNRILGTIGQGPYPPPKDL